MAGVHRSVPSFRRDTYGYPTGALAVAGKGWDGQVPVALSEPTVGVEADGAGEADGE